MNTMIPTHMRWMVVYATVLMPSLSISGVQGDEAKKCDKIDMQCETERRLVPLARVDGEVTVAVSLVCGRYGQGTLEQDPWRMVRGSQVAKKLAGLPDSRRWHYPEHVILQNFDAARAAERDRFLDCYQPGYTRALKASAFPEEKMEQMREILKDQKDLLLMHKARIGPYVRMQGMITTALPGGGEPWGRDESRPRMFPFVEYFVRQDDRWWITLEMTTMSSPLDDIVGGAAQRLDEGAGEMMHSDIAAMHWLAFDVDLNAPPKDRGRQPRIESSGRLGDAVRLPEVFSEHHAILYYRVEPLDIKLAAGETSLGLPPKLSLIESAMTALESGDIEQIAPYWKERDADSIRRSLAQAKKSGQWEKTGFFPGKPFSSPLRILGRIRTPEGDIYLLRQARSLRAVVLSPEEGEFPYVLSHSPLAGTGEGAAVSRIFNNQQRLILEAVDEQLPIATRASDP